MTRSKGLRILLLACGTLVFAACTTEQEATETVEPVVEEYVNSAIVPVPRWTFFWKNRDNLGWLERHGKILVRIQLDPPVGAVFLGDSITHGFDWAGAPVWERDFSQWNPVNMGFGGDRTQHVLWRIENGALDGISPRVAVVMIGTNNWQANTAEEIAEGVLAICAAIHERLPEAKILLLSIFPRNEPGSPQRLQVDETNAILEKSGLPEWVHWLDIGAAFLDGDGVIPEDIMPDGLHPSAQGYELWSAAMLPELERLMGE